jgi:acetyl-CoA synthase
MYVEFGGQRTEACELVKMRDKDEIEDGKVEVIGPDIEDIEDGDKLPLGIKVDLWSKYGRGL